MDKLLCTIPEAVSMASVSRSYLYERMADGSIRSVKAGRKRLVDVASLKAWADALPATKLKQINGGQ